MERIRMQDVPSGMNDQLMATENYINDSPLGEHLLELLRLRVAQLNHCAYCLDMHHKKLKHLGESDLRLSSVCVWEETPYFDEKEVAALQFADELTTLSNGSPLASTFSALEKHFSKPEICYLTLAIAHINTWTRLMKTFNFTPGKYKVREHEAV